MTSPDALDLASLSTRRPLRQLGAALLDWGLIAAAIALAVALDHVAVDLLAIVLIGTRQHALLILMHEAAHRHLARSRRLNDGLGNLLMAWPMGVTVERYRANHLAHHRLVNQDGDPDLQRTVGPEAWYPEHWRFPMSPRQAAGLLLRDLLGLNTIEQLRKLRHFGGGEAREEPGTRAWPRVAFYLAAAALITAAGAWKGVLVFWLLPMLTVLKVLLRVRMVAEHYGIEGSEMGTRTLEISAVARFLCWPHAIALHAEHHRYPTVPFFRLGELRAALQARGMVAIVPRGGPTVTTIGAAGLLRECLSGGDAAATSVSRLAVQDR